MREPAAPRRLLACTLLLLTTAASQADPVADVATLLAVIRQDQPVPTLPYLRRAAPINTDCDYFIGRYRATSGEAGSDGPIAIQVETHPNSTRVASILLELPGPDRTRQILPAVVARLGPPHASDPARSTYQWGWPKFRAASLHYVAGGAGIPGVTVVSLFYR